MTESTIPTSLESQADKIKADLSAILLKAAQANAKASPSAAPASNTATEQKSSPAAQ